MIGTDYGCGTGTGARRRSPARGRDRCPPRTPVGGALRRHRGREAVPAGAGGRHPRRAGRRRVRRGGRGGCGGRAAPHRVRHPRRRHRRRRRAPRAAQRQRHVPLPSPGSTGPTPRWRRATGSPPRSWPATSPSLPRSAPSRLSGAPAPVVERLLDLFDTALHTHVVRRARRRPPLARPRPRHPRARAWRWRSRRPAPTPSPCRCRRVRCSPAPTPGRPAGSVTAGRAMGIAFQLADDLIGVFGDPARSGKSATSDLRTRKQTPLLAHARTTSGVAADQRLRRPRAQRRPSSTRPARSSWPPARAASSRSSPRQHLGQAPHRARRRWASRPT